MKNEAEILTLLNSIQKGIKKYGIKKIIKTLNSLELANSKDLDYEARSYIISIVCKTLKVEPYLLYGFNSRGDVTTARKLCIFLFRKHLSISAAEAAIHFNRSRQIAFTAEKEFKNMSDKNIQHKSFLEIYKKLDIKISYWVSQNIDA